MSALEDDALTLMLVKVVRDRLARMDDAARERVKAALKPGGRWVVTVPDPGHPEHEEVEVGGITRTKPSAGKPAPAVTDPAAFLEWVGLVRPDEVEQPPAPPAPPERVRPAFEKWVLEAVAGKHEHEPWVDPSTGEVAALPPGVEWKAKAAPASTLQVRATDDTERVLLEAMRSGVLALPAVLDDLPALEGGSARGSPDPQREPAAASRAAARAIRDMYLALCAEGFREHQALVIVGQVVAGSIARPPE